MDDVLKELGLTSYDVKTSNNISYIDLLDENKFAKVFSKLNSSNDFWEDEESSSLDLDGSQYAFENNNYYIIITSNFIEDKYSITIEEL